MSGCPSWARRGQEVVCIKAGPWRDIDGRESALPHPYYGQVVTIRDVVEWLNTDWWFITLVEFDPAMRFDVDHFRPVQPDDIEARLFAERHSDERVPA